MRQIVKAGAAAAAAAPLLRANPAAAKYDQVVINLSVPRSRFARRRRAALGLALPEAGALRAGLPVVESC